MGILKLNPNSWSVKNLTEGFLLDFKEKRFKKILILLNSKDKKELNRLKHIKAKNIENLQQ